MKLDDQFTVVAPLGGDIDGLLAAQNGSSFSPQAISFVSDLSNALMRDPRTAAFPEVIAMAYWLRKANVKRMQADFEKHAPGLRMARGTVFHIAPSNVDTIFVYSLFLSIFSGNKNIVRLSSSPNEQVDSILAVMNATLSNHPDLSDAMLIVRYEHSEEISHYFSSLCDVRMIWGGDETIRRIRSIPIPPRAKELTFADRFSMALVDADAYLSADSESQAKCAENFYNDSFWFDQMACSSPRMVCWVGKGESLKAAQTLFWQQLELQLAQKEHSIPAAAVMDKLVAQCSYAVEGHNVSIPEGNSGLVSRVLTTEVSNQFREIHCGSGLFLEVEVDSLNKLADYIDQKVQTVSCFGVDKQQLQEFMLNAKPSGVDRFVAFGEALNFSPLWDGYNLLEELSRIVDISVKS